MDKKTFDLDAIMEDDSNGPSMSEVNRAMRILRQPDVAWALDIVRQAHAVMGNTPGAQKDEADG